MNKSLRDFPAKDILAFWFGEAVDKPEALSAQSPLWFSGGEAVDREISQRFGTWFDLLAQTDAEAFSVPDQLLAAVILLDQFSRNCFRGEARAFAYDVFALDLLDYAIGKGWDKKLHPLQRAFLYMPLQHIEHLDGQDLGVKLFASLAEQAPSGYERILRGNAEYAVEHRDLIAQFGRFPHRNKVLEREDTPEERAYLDGGGKRFGQ